MTGRRDEADVREALAEAIDVLDGMNDDEINVELLPRLRAALSTAPATADLLPQTAIDQINDLWTKRHGGMSERDWADVAPVLLGYLVAALSNYREQTPPTTDEAMSHDEADLLGIVSRMHTAWMQRDELMRQQGGIELIEKMAGLLDQIADDVPVLWKATAKALSHPAAELSRMSGAPKSATDEDVKLCEALLAWQGDMPDALKDDLREAAARISQIPTLIEERDRLREAVVALAYGADRCAGDPHYIVQPFFDIFRKHGEAIEQARALVSRSEPR